ncbi:RNA polymerase sigma factor [Ekhidna sp.]|uniref:RNA polymerase sigma factor n=1 Tax=Ekhidna sp. TaxID=2608089 RepID=UPI003298BE7A
MEDQIIEKIAHEETRNYGFNLLVHEYQERIYWHVRKMVIDHDDADDLVQEIFVKVWKNLSKFRADSKLYTWVYRIATNECLNFLKKKKRRFFMPIHDLEGELAEKLTSSLEPTGDEVQMKLNKALLKLPDKQRMVFNMKYYDEMKFSDIAEITGTSIGALKASYHHAVKKIEDFINSN